MEATSITAPMMAAAEKQHGEIQQPGAEKHRSEETILLLAEPVAQHADEPQERDTGKRNEVQRKCDLPRIGGEPCARLQRINRNGAAQQREDREHQQGKQDPRQRRRLRRLQTCVSERIVCRGRHRSLLASQQDVQDQSLRAREAAFVRTAAITATRSGRHPAQDDGTMARARGASLARDHIACRARLAG